jgi:rRNA-processing protein FCF1
MVLSHKAVLLDTNFVLSCYRFGISLDEIHAVIDEGHRIYVPQNMLEELGQLHLKGKDKEAQESMLQILDHYPVLLLRGTVDASLLKYAQEHDCIVCTNDRELRKALKALGRRVVFVRARSHLAIE